jgi:hypothetical protein
MSVAGRWVVTRLSLFAESARHLVVFFSHNKSANNTFSYVILDKRTSS